MQFSVLDRQRKNFGVRGKRSESKNRRNLGSFLFQYLTQRIRSKRILTKKIFKLSSNESIGTHQSNIMKRCIKILTLSCGLPKCMCFFNLKFETWWFSFELKIITEDAVFSLVNWMLIVSLWAVKIMSTLAKNARTLTRAS